MPNASSWSREIVGYQSIRECSENTSQRIPGILSQRIPEGSTRKYLLRKW
jgi:hypothetical protein